MLNEYKNIKRRRPAAFASEENFLKYEDTGDSKYLNDVQPQKLKVGSIFYALGEGWEEKRIKLTNGFKVIK